MPLGSVIAEFVDGYRYDRSPRTLGHYEDWAARFLAFAGADTLLCDLTPKHVTDYLIDTANRRRIAASQVRKQYDYLHRFLAWCVEQEYAPGNVADRVRPPRVPEASRVAFTRDEVKRMVAVTSAKPGAMGTRDRAILAMLLDTGIRASELVGMRLKDVEWTHRRILVHGKGDKDRRLPFGQRTASALRLWLKARYDVPGDALWLNLRRGVMTYATLSKSLELLGGYADVDECTPHRFRHTFAVEHYRAHRDLLALQSLLGHSEVKTTMTYLRTLGVDYGSEAGHRSPGEWLLG